jgi:hypothetical protein
LSAAFTTSATRQEKRVGTLRPVALMRRISSGG